MPFPERGSLDWIKLLCQGAPCLGCVLGGGLGGWSGEQTHSAKTRLKGGANREGRPGQGEVTAGPSLGVGISVWQLVWESACGSGQAWRKRHLGLGKELSGQKWRMEDRVSRQDAAGLKCADRHTERM